MRSLLSVPLEANVCSEVIVLVHLCEVKSALYLRLSAWHVYSGP